jgi:hypothetical protein
VEVEQLEPVGFVDRGIRAEKAVGSRLECMRLGQEVVASLVASAVALAVAYSAGLVPTMGSLEHMASQFATPQGPAVMVLGKLRMEPRVDHAELQQAALVFERQCSGWQSSSSLV